MMRSIALEKENTDIAVTRKRLAPTVLDTSKDMSCTQTPSLLQQLDESLSGLTLNGRKDPLANVLHIAANQRPPFLEPFGRKVTDPWDKDTEAISLKLLPSSKVVQLMRKSLSNLANNSLSSIAAWPPLNTTSLQREIGRLEYLGGGDPLAAERAELRMLKILMLTGKIQLPSGGMDTMVKNALSLMTTEEISLLLHPYFDYSIDTPFVWNPKEEVYPFSQGEL